MVYQEKLFTKKECEIIIKLAEPIKADTSDTFFDAVSGRVNYSDNLFKKSYNVSIIHNNDKTNWVFNKLLKWFSEKTNILIKPGLTINGGLIHKYNIGDLFEKHTDINIKFMDRRYNIGIQLNEGYIGGDYNYWLNNQIHTFSKEIGTAILYPVDILHEVTEITDGNRISFVTHIGSKLIKTNSLL